MLIKVRFFGEIKQLLKRSWMVLEIPERSSLNDLILELDKKMELTLHGKLVEGTGVRPEIMILLNGKSITTLAGLQTELKDQDTISILPVVGGG